MIYQIEEAECPHCQSMISTKDINVCINRSCPECGKMITSHIKVVSTLDQVWEKK